MAGISVSLDGANIQLSFQKDDQATAVVMDARAARALVRAVGQLLTAIDDTDEPDMADEMGDEEVAMLDVTSSAIEIGEIQSAQFRHPKRSAIEELKHGVIPELDRVDLLFVLGAPGRERLRLVRGCA